MEWTQSVKLLAFGLEKVRFLPRAPFDYNCCMKLLVPRLSNPVEKSPGSDRGKMRYLQQTAYMSGAALRRHIIAVHNGVVDASCPACKELLVKSKK